MNYKLFTLVSHNTIRSPSKWLFIVLGLSLSLLVGLASMNYIIDPYHIFHSSFYEPGPHSNDRFNKIEHLVTTNKKYNSYIIGSSRMSVYEPAVANFLSPGNKFYNLSLLGSDYKEILSTLEYLKQSYKPINSVILGLDLYPFMESTHSDSPDKRAHPLLNSSSYFIYKFRYLFEPSVFQSLVKYCEGSKATPEVKFNFATNGTYEFPKGEESIRTDQVAHINSFKRVDNQQVVWNENAYGELSDLLTWFDVNDVDVKLFVHPFSKHYLQRISPSDYKQWKSRISALVGDVPDFNEDYDITNNAVNYYDEKHYRPSVATHVLRKLFSGGA